MRAQAHLAVLAEHRPGEGQQRALEVGQGDVLVHGQALDLVELRRVRGVVVGPVDAAGHDDVQRRRLQLHRAHLHRRGVHAQELGVGLEQRVGIGDVEGVRRLARRVLRVVVEGVEVVVDELDLGALGDREPEPEEDVLDLAPGGGDQVQAPGRQRRVAGQGDVDRVGGQARVELAGLQGRRRAPRSRPRSPGGPGCRPCRRRRAARAAGRARRAGAGAARPCGPGSAPGPPRARALSAASPTSRAAAARISSMRSTALIGAAS